VRDRIPDIIQVEGRRPVTRVLDEASYRQALLAKLIEQAQQASVDTTPQPGLPVSWPPCWKCSAP
jgi:predicted house-cleaning noncanonical NTP pyrophosphatase (MazG superfamily)